MRHRKGADLARVARSLRLPVHLDVINPHLCRQADPWNSGRRRTAL